MYILTALFIGQLIAYHWNKSDCDCDCDYLDF